MITIETGQVWTRDDGARLRVGGVKNGNVHIVVWDPERSVGVRWGIPADRLLAAIEDCGAICLGEADHMEDEA